MKKIGITTTHYESALGFYSNGVNKQYQERIIASQGLPILIPLNEHEDFKLLQELAENYARNLDALLITGGADVTPSLYSKPIQQGCGDFDYDRDIWEILLIKKFMTAGKPIMGICRGLQIINVALDGTLVQDMDNKKYEKHWHNIKRTHQKAHLVNSSGQHFLNIFGPSIYVNSFHHQCIDELAPILRVNTEYMVSKDDVIEGFYNAEYGLLGVQWHPEMLRDNVETQALFDFFMSLSPTNMMSFVHQQIS